MYKDRKPPLWQKEVYALSTDYTIDLRKNDSLIRPYIGTLEIAKITYSQTFVTREAAETCDTPNYKDDESRRYVLLLIRKVNGWLRSDFLALQNSDLWNVTAVRNSMEWRNVLELSDEIKELLKQ